MTRRRCCSTVDPFDGSPCPRAARPAFTLVEMIVVVAIILIILGLALPALNALWDERKLSDAQTMIQGLLMTSRARAMETDGVDSGLFFFVDREGTQRVVPILQANPGNLVWQHVFGIDLDRARDHALPSPIRVVPRYVVDRTGDESWDVFSNAELANNGFDHPLGDAAQTHRNHFAMVYGTDGRLIRGRDVLVQDADSLTDTDVRGDVTGLHVGVGDRVENHKPEVEAYWSYDGRQEEKPLDPEGQGGTVPFLVTDGGGVAVNFRSVDGLLVYDDSLFNEAGTGASADAGKRAFLLRTAHPFYVNPLTGQVVRGPVGESDAP